MPAIARIIETITVTMPHADRPMPRRAGAVLARALVPVMEDFCLSGSLYALLSYLLP